MRPTERTLYTLQLLFNSHSGIESHHALILATVGVDGTIIVEDATDQQPDPLHT